MEPSGRRQRFAPNCLSIDLEVGIRDGRIHHFAAVRGDTDAAFVSRQGYAEKDLGKLDDFAAGTAFLLGHNLIAFDLPHLVAAKPDLYILKLPAVDTLRLNPLAFPRNPYHHLVKHYQDGQLKRGRLNDPELDARLALDLFRDQYAELRALNDSAPDLILAWHWLTTVESTMSGLDSFFTSLRARLRPSDTEARSAIQRLLHNQSCLHQADDILASAAEHGWALAYALAWLSVAGGNSVMPPWVRHQFPEASVLIRRLRDTPCSDPACPWCSERHNARKELQRWFGLPDFRPEPRGEDGRSLQQSIVEAAMRGEHVLGILPTGTGKSLCYQIPALSRYEKTGALTVVISPLVALMADQINGLANRGIHCCAAINGLLSMPERSDALDRVRLGDIGILVISPEQLRNRAVRKVLAQREIGAWVLDEAHCLSKWGHDFRPDYRYVGRFIRDSAGDATIPPVLCLTATAKPDVVADIVGHFSARLGIGLRVFDGGSQRSNLDFVVVQTTPAEKFADIHRILMSDLPPDVPGGAIVYCATRRKTEEVAAFLRATGIAAAHFHAHLPPETKKNVQENFIRGELRVIAATNAFGMGIDKPDVRVVIHADIPGSLENYLQEAGRAGRDREAARCVLLYTQEDVERQFGMSAHSRLSLKEIRAVLKALRRLDRRKRLDGEVVATPGEILAEESEGDFGRDSATDDTRVRTAVAWLEEAVLLSREENRCQVFPSSLRVGSVDEARQKLAKQPMHEEYRRQLLNLIAALIGADPDEGVSTDELMGLLGLNPERIRNALYDLERLGLASNDTVLTAFVHSGVERASMKRFEEAVALETALIAELRLAAPDLDKDESSMLHLRIAAQRLKDAGHPGALPEKLQRLLSGLAADGRAEDSGTGSLRLRRIDSESVNVTLQRRWSALEKTARLRRIAAQRLLEHLLACLPPGTRGTDLLAETTLGKLTAAMEGDLMLKAEMKNPPKLLQTALLWLHDQDVIRLNKGFTVFRAAMTIRLAPDKRGFAKADFEPLKLHYDEQVLQIHVMAEYAQRGLKAVAEALRMAMDYFRLDRDAFLRQWLPGREKELSRQTTPESWRNIVESLQNPAQQRIVADDREQTNVLVLAGPGSGKTRVLVHRIAYLIRVRRENPRGILALAYNRHAAAEIRKRLAGLIGDDARGITVLTCHALAMRLAGVSFAERWEKTGDEVFQEVLRQAIALLKGEGLPPEEADEQRDRLLAGYRWILVDEYQDIGPDQYELISALAGRTLQDEDSRLNLLAVGDDDQNIYAFNGASVEFIRRFEADYAAKPAYLTENYRSTSRIIEAANRLIGDAPDRMKQAHPITIDRARKKAAPGGDWEAIDPVGQGRVQILPAGVDERTQAVTVMREFERLASLAPNWDWTRCAVIARKWDLLEPVRSYCELAKIPVQMAGEETVPFRYLRETRTLLAWLKDTKLVDAAKILSWLDERPAGPWWNALRQAAEEYAVETGGAELPSAHFEEWLAEWGREIRRRPSGLMLLSAHRAKGLEFDHVAVLDGGWKAGAKEDRHSPRRLYYVAMTRARKTLTLTRIEPNSPLLDSLAGIPDVLHRPPTEHMQLPPELSRRYRKLTLKDVHLGFAGRYPETDPIHQAIAALEAGDPLWLKRKNDVWELNDAGGNTVGRLARAFDPPKGMICIQARAAAIIIRRRDETEADYLSGVCCDAWEVVIPELVFEPAGKGRT
ncbi:RecQ family ATP-dependent DNA helicase [Methylococcus capsulatus]|uniref:RecQ family ATP-dependent DNA helicase n=1 Tax=Methylococcus capsulatus TaxID=414 RepID=UPI00211B3953|nr:RecQ family ATP-dependent DNA helicase [Methylococcus capsulatus]